MKIHKEDKGKANKLQGKELEVYQYYLKTGETLKVIANKFNFELSRVSNIIDKGLAAR